ncbi:MAG TPA: hypothetical protein VFK40_04265 [Nitrososphaeraceae archaeon]|nr:hypothetical protein [Nitrososphaeraceae archaeon]
MTDDEKSKEDIKRDIIQDYDSVLRESSVPTSLSGFIFGFLLNISLNSPSGFSAIYSIILMVSLYSITFAVSLFVMPIIYHHTQYPYKDIEKFKMRAHYFIKIGIIPRIITLYLGLILGLKFTLHLDLCSEFENYSYFLAIVPFIFVYVIFLKRK